MSGDPLRRHVELTQGLRKKRFKRQNIWLDAVCRGKPVRSLDPDRLPTLAPVASCAEAMPRDSSNEKTPRLWGAWATWGQRKP